MNTKPIVGVIGGTGLGQALAAQSGVESVTVETPFGPPSSPILMANWNGQAVAFLSRHGDGHVFNPSQVPYRANIFALKTLGVTHILASGATGSLREHIRPRELVVPDQIIDKTFRRPSTFFDAGIVVHVEFAQPFCPMLRRTLLECASAVPTKVHDGGVYVCMEGPQFSTVAESQMHRAWGGDLIGMTCMPEAKLAREAEICYALVALPTDFDCWKLHEPGKTGVALLTEIIGNLEQSTQYAVRLIQASVSALADRIHDDCTCRHALELGIWSDKSKLDPHRFRELKPLLEKYIPFDPKV